MFDQTRQTNFPRSKTVRICARSIDARKNIYICVYLGTREYSRIGEKTRMVVFKRRKEKRGQDTRLVSVPCNSIMKKVAFVLMLNA